VLPTFVIGLREGLEASLIVGIIAAFLGQQGNRAALRQVWIGTALAVAICIAVAAALDIVSSSLPHRQQAGLETVIGVIAVAMVSYMVLWVRSHASDLRGELERVAGSALASGSSRALVLMALLAVLREGFETAVFLLATFNASHDVAASASGALLGLLVAAALGYAIYRGGVRINLGRFFRVTGIVLVVIAAGLVMTAIHTAAEAGWLSVGQQQAFDLTWLVRPGTLVEPLVSGVLGIQPHPVWIEVIGWVVYLVPMLALVALPRRPRRRRRAARRTSPVSTSPELPADGH